jgi:predicted DNA-binding transcriptional regulator AlpA
MTPLLTEKDVARLLAVSIHTMRSWRQRKQGPPWRKLLKGGVRYDQAELEQWIKTGRKEK